MTREQEGTTPGVTADGGADRLTIADPVACVIRVRGALAPRWADRLGGLAITVCDRSRTGDAVTTELRGALPDQAALLGVLTTLCDLRLPLVSVACAPAAGKCPADRD
jgi:hypothetical protein